MPAPGDSLPRDLPDRIVRDGLVQPGPLRAVLRRTFPDWADRLDYHRLQVVQPTYILDDWRRREADVLVRLPLLDAQDGEILLCVLIEHQSGPDQATPLRLLLHAVLYWEKEWHEWEKQHRRGQPLRLTPILPLVFHTGPEPWTSNRSVADLFAGPQELRAFAPTWPAQLWDLPQHPPAELLQEEEGWWQAMAVVRVDRAETGEFFDVLRQALQRLQPLAERDHHAWEHLLKLVLSWGLFRRPRAEQAQVFAEARSQQASVQLQEEIEKMTQQLGQSWAEEVFSQGKAQGLAEGKAEGKAEGREAGQVEAYRKILLNLLRRRFPDLPATLAQRIAAADVPHLEAAIEQAYSIQSPDELQL